MADRALITGVTGFVGGHLARRLAAEGWEVHGVVRRPPGDPAVRALHGICAAHYHDGTMESLTRLVALSRPTVVFHLAARFVAEHRPADIDLLVRDNVLFGAQLLEAMGLAGAKRIVNAGSAWQHFKNAEYSPVSLYAATKKAFGDLLQYFVEANGVHAITLELSDTYGPGDTRRKLIAIMLDAEKNKRELSMVSGELPLNFVHVDDAVSAFVMAARRLTENKVAGHEVYAVRSDEPVTVRDLFAIWEKSRGAALGARWGERPYRAREVLEHWSQGTLLPGWSAGISLSEGLRTL
ncbi:MAG TPA: NAD-dependent epimerase/dehydratase family protein [Gemmatimonadaceae bacterium]|nr:NAD-dependent epimerase/dehydratase family protein [Gemmatimonadaceae bacterium]